MSQHVDTILRQTEQWVRADKLRVRLQNDGKYVVEQQVERAPTAEPSAAVCDASALHDLGAMRLVVEEWNTLVPCHARLPHRAVESLLSSLLRVPDGGVQALFVDAMAATTKVSHDSAAASSNGHRTTEPTSIPSSQADVQEWIVTALADPRAVRARELLAITAARLFPREFAQRVLISILSERPEHTDP
jgi:hypothetical protein